MEGRRPGYLFRVRNDTQNKCSMVKSYQWIPSLEFTSHSHDLHCVELEGSIRNGFWVFTIT